MGARRRNEENRAGGKLPSDAYATFLPSSFLLCKDSYPSYSAKILILLTLQPFVSFACSHLVSYYRTMTLSSRIRMETS